MRECKTTDDLGAPADQFNWEFVDGMVKRMATSYHKYGHMRKARDADIDLMKAMQQRIDLYNETGNTEWLMDAANFLMMEFTTPGHPEAHYRATDSGESPGVPQLGMEPVIPGARRGTKQIHGRHSL